MSILIRNGTVVTAAGEYRADVLIEGETISAVGRGLSAVAGRVIDAEGLYILPGGIDGHTHMELPFGGTTSADDFRTGTIAAAVGGTTTIIDFAVQSRGGRLGEAVREWKSKAQGKAVIDYGLHVIVSDPGDSALAEIPSLVAEGVTSFKLFLAYKGALQVDDGALFRTLRAVKEAGGLVSLHCENGEVIEILTEELLAAGKTAPRYHAASRPAEVEGEAVARAITLAGLAGAAILIVHVSAAQSVEQIAAARRRGQAVFAETCMHYLLLSEEKYDQPAFEGAKYVCSPPLRPAWHRDHLWRGLAAGDLQVLGSDHCPFNFRGQKEMGKESFAKIPNGCPGIEDRISLLFTCGVRTGRLSLSRLVEVTSTAPARLYGLYPRKGAIAPGSDADLILFDPERAGTIGAGTQAMNVDYSLYEGFEVRGLPAAVISRGEIIVSDGRFTAQEGRGRFLERGRPLGIRPEVVLPKG